MVTDDERRRAAERLRSLAGGYVTIGEMEDALGICMSSPIIDLERDARDLHRLADLIEPSCDRDALLVLADEIERTADFDTGIDPHVLLSFAHRIREACGGDSDGRP